MVTHLCLLKKFKNLKNKKRKKKKRRLPPCSSLMARRAWFLRSL